MTNAAHGPRGPAHQMAVFRKKFESLRWQVVLGNAHLQLWKGLSERLFSDSKRLALNVAPTFFGMTIQSHLDSAFLYAARIFDADKRSHTLEKVLDSAAGLRTSLSRERRLLLDESLTAAPGEIARLQFALQAVRVRRDKMLAHLDPDMVRDPHKIIGKGTITLQELQSIFDAAWTILNGVYSAFWELTFSLKLSDIDDYDSVINYVEMAKKLERARY